VDAIRRVLAFRQDAAAAAYRSALDVENVEELFSLASAEDATGRVHDMTLAIAATLDFSRTTAKAVPALWTELASAEEFESLPYSKLSWAPLPKPPPPYTPDTKATQRPLHDWYAAAMLGLLGIPRADAKNTFITFNYDLVLEDAIRAVCGPSTTARSRTLPTSRHPR
jgi:hypothetical protein